VSMLGEKLGEVIIDQIKNNKEFRSCRFWNVKQNSSNELYRVNHVSLLLQMLDRVGDQQFEIKIPTEKFEQLVELSKTNPKVFYKGELKNKQESGEDE